MARLEHDRGIRGRWLLASILLGAAAVGTAVYGIKTYETEEREEVPCPIDVILFPGDQTTVLGVSIAYDPDQQGRKDLHITDTLLGQRLENDDLKPGEAIGGNRVYASMPKENNPQQGIIVNIGCLPTPSPTPRP